MKTNNKVTDGFMKELALATGLTYDGGDDDRLFAETIFTNSKDMTESEYEAMEKDIRFYCLQGKGFQVGAWNDESGYKYWNVKHEEDNYIQVTVYITGKSIDAAEVRKLVTEAINYFSSYSRY